MVISPDTSRALLRFLRFLIVGGVNTLASYLVFCGCIWIGLHFTLATLVSYGVGVLIGFKMHGRFVFEHPGARDVVRREEFQRQGATQARDVQPGPRGQRPGKQRHRQP